MASTGFINSQSQLKYGDAASPENFTAIYQCSEFSGLGTETPLVEITDLSSTAKEFVGGLPEGKQFTFKIIYNPTNATHIALLAAVGATKNYKYVLPSTGGGSKTFSFAAVLMGYQEEQVTPESAMAFVFTGKFTGAITGPV